VDREAQVLVHRFTLLLDQDLGDLHREHLLRLVRRTSVTLRRSFLRSPACPSGRRSALNTAWDVPYRGTSRQGSEPVDLTRANLDDPQMGRGLDVPPRQHVCAAFDGTCNPCAGFRTMSERPLPGQATRSGWGIWPRRCLRRATKAWEHRARPDSRSPSAALPGARGAHRCQHHFQTGVVS
jgi:hypothetical protein